jgi:hypothetical protein
MQSYSYRKSGEVGDAGPIVQGVPGAEMLILQDAGELIELEKEGEFFGDRQLSLIVMEGFPIRKVNHRHTGCARLMANLVIQDW